MDFINRNTKHLKSIVSVLCISFDTFSIIELSFGILTFLKINYVFSVSDINLYFIPLTSLNYYHHSMTTTISVVFWVYLTCRNDNNFQFIYALFSNPLHASDLFSTFFIRKLLLTSIKTIFFYIFTLYLFPIAITIYFTERLDL